MSILLFSAVGGTQINPDEALHGHTVDVSAITTTSAIQGLNALHAHLTDTATVATSLVAPDEALHGHTADASALFSNIAPADTLHSQTVDAAATSPIVQVVPRETLHATFTDQGSVYGAPPAELILELVVTTVKVQLIGV